jgi:hypothetical protein
MPKETLDLRQGYPSIGKGRGEGPTYIVEAIALISQPSSAESGMKGGLEIDDLRVFVLSSAGTDADEDIRADWPPCGRPHVRLGLHASQRTFDHGHHRDLDKIIGFLHREGDEATIEVNILPFEVQDVSLAESCSEGDDEDRPKVRRRRVHQPLDLRAGKYVFMAPRSFPAEADALDGVPI